MFQTVLNHRYLKAVVIILFALIYCSISLVNHYNFRTYSLDLGVYNNAAYDFCHFQSNTCTQLLDITENYFADHFALIPVLVSPLFWIFGSYTMLIVQIVSILFGGLGVYKYISTKTESVWLPLLAMIHFFVLWGIYSALAFDYHDNVVAAMLVPWFLYYFEKENWRATILFFVLIAVSKENMALWLVFICAGLMLMNLKNKRTVFYLGILIASAAVYFIVITKFLMPSLNPHGVLNQLGRYSGLGNDVKEVAITILTKPAYVWELFIKDENGIKAEVYFLLFFSGGIALFLRPVFFVMLAPIFLQKFLTSDQGVWSINGHYSIEFAPILSLALFSLLAGLRSSKLSMTLSLFSVCITAIATFVKIENPVPIGYSPVHKQFYKAFHYQREFDVKKINKALELIPANARVSAQTEIAPHLAFRDVFYSFPRVDDAEYIVLLKNGNSYPLMNDDYQDRIQDLIYSDDFGVIYNDCDLLIVKKGTLTKQDPGKKIERKMNREREKKIGAYERKIRNNGEWLQKLKVAAAEQGCSLDSMLRVNAIYMIGLENAKH